MELGKEYFGPLWSFVASDEITDIDYNGKEIWLTNIFNERFRANQQFVSQYMTLLDFSMNKAIRKYTEGSFI